MSRFETYRGTIQHGGNRYNFLCADRSDAGQLARMYANISINTENYQTRFDPSSEQSFARVGGMFEIHTKESIEAEIESGRSFFAVLKDAEGTIAASFWVSEEDPHFAGFDPGAMPGCGSCQCKLADALRAGKVIYPRELIVNGGRRLPGISHAMFYTIFTVMRQNGVTHSLGEVYGVRGYKEGGRAAEINMLNERSFHMTAGTGGRYIGDSPGFEVDTGSVTVTILPRAFCFDYAALLPGLGQKLTDLGMEISFIGEGAL
ncbi:MAG: hypothetical protein FWG31_04690 [Oscillospiraceae bacterium]|nr:hypothetical protein [Oscillospiraceae bacterium]